MQVLSLLSVTLSDLRRTLRRSSLIFLLGWQDIKQRYRRSKIGPFWLTISMAIMIGMIGLIFGQVMNNPMREYLPFLAIGIVFWTFISSSIMEGISSYIEAQGMIRQLDIPLLIYPMRVLWRNVIVLGHNSIILLLVLLVMGNDFTFSFLWVVPGFFLLLINIFWITVLMAIICTRFRDMPQIVNSLLQVLFYLTPVIWMPGALSGKTKMMILDPNPMYHLIEIVRAPLLGGVPTLLNWSVVLAMSLFGVLLSSIFYGKYRFRIAYWL